MSNNMVRYVLKRGPFYHDRGPFCPMILVRFVPNVVRFVQFLSLIHTCIRKVGIIRDFIGLLPLVKKCPSPRNYDLSSACQTIKFLDSFLIAKEWIFDTFKY